MIVFLFGPTLIIITIWFFVKMEEWKTRQEFELEKLRQFNTAVMMTGTILPFSETVKRNMVVDALKNGMHYERFKFVKLLGSGTFGRVYQVKLKNGREDAAMKLINPSQIRNGPTSNPLAEVDILRKVKGRRGFIQIIGAFVHINPIIVTQLAAGSLYKATPLNSNTVIRLGYQLIDGLAFLERKRIIHGDLKPENILLTANSNVLISDFGLSAVLKPEQHFYQHPELTGTLNYSHYQTIVFYRVSHRTDVFALGVTLYELARNQLLILPDASVKDPTPQHIAETQIYGRMYPNGMIFKYPDYIRTFIHNIALQNLILAMTNFNQTGQESGIPLASKLLESEMLQQAMTVLQGQDVWDGSWDGIVIPDMTSGGNCRRFTGIEFFNVEAQYVQMTDLARMMYYEDGGDMHIVPRTTDGQTQTTTTRLQEKAIQIIPYYTMTKAVQTDEKHPIDNYDIDDYSKSIKNCFTKADSDQN